MGDAALAKKPDQAPAAEPAKQKPPLGMNAEDHTTYEDLLFQQAAQNAIAAVMSTAHDKRGELAGRAVTQVGTALDSYAGANARQLPLSMFPSIDAVFMALWNLHRALLSDNDPSSTTRASSVQAAMFTMKDRLAPAGWKEPASAVEGQERAVNAAKSGSTVLTVDERARLGTLHLRAGRQALLDGWEAISAGRLTALEKAANSLTSAAAILADPRLAESLPDAAAEVERTEVVFERVMTSLTEIAPPRVRDLGGLASSLDALLRIVDREPRWSALVSHGSATTTSATQVGNAGASASATPKSDAPDPRAPRAEPPAHKVDQIQHFRRLVHIMDTNYIDEYIGYVELFFEAYRTTTGQVYVQQAEAKKHFDEDGTQYLSIGANVKANSISLNGQQFCDVYFDVEIGGPNKTETETVAVGAKLSASATDSGETGGGEVSASVTFSTAITSRGSKSFRRVYRVSSLAQPIKLMEFDHNDPNRPKMSSVSMHAEERTDLHQDFEGFRLDDDDVGDTLFDPNADWVLHSYSEE